MPMDIQFVTFDQGKGVYVCQFVERDQPDDTIRLTHSMLRGLKVRALETHFGSAASFNESVEQVERIDELFTRLANSEMRAAKPPTDSSVA